MADRNLERKQRGTGVYIVNQKVIKKLVTLMLSVMMIFGSLGAPLSYAGTQIVEAKTTKKKPSKGSKPKSSKSSKKSSKGSKTKKSKSSKKSSKGSKTKKSKSSKKSSKGSKTKKSKSNDGNDSTESNGDDAGTNSYTKGVYEVLSRWGVWAGVAANKNKEDGKKFVKAINDHPAAVWSVMYPANVSKGHTSTLFNGDQGAFGSQYTISMSNAQLSVTKGSFNGKVKAVFNYYSALTDAHLLNTDVNKNPLGIAGRWIIMGLSSLTLLANKMSAGIFKIAISAMAIVNPYVGIAYLTGNSHFLTKKYLGKGVVGKNKTYSGGQFWTGIFGTKKSGNESIVNIWQALVALVVVIYFIIFAVSIARAVITGGQGQNGSLGQSLGRSIWTYLQRILIVYLAPIILGVVGATVLGEVSTMAQSSMNDRASNFVYSNFIDVENWAKNSRFGIPETASHNVVGTIYANKYSNITQKYTNAINVYEASSPGTSDMSNALTALNTVLIPYAQGKTFNASTVAIAPMQNAVIKGVNIKELKWFSAKAAFNSDVISKTSTTDSLAKTLALKPENNFNNASLAANLKNTQKDSGDNNTGAYDTIFLADGSLTAVKGKSDYYYVGKAWHVKTKATPGTLAGKAGLTSAGLINFLSISSVSNGALTFDMNGNYEDYGSIAYTAGSSFTGIAKAVTFCLSATFAGVVTIAVVGAIMSRLMAVTMDTLKNGVGILRGDLQAVVIMLKDMTVTCLQVLLGIILIIASSGVGGMVENIFDNATDNIVSAKWGAAVIAPGPLASSSISAGGFLTFLKYVVEAVFYVWLIKTSFKSLRTFMDSINAMFDKTVDKMGLQHGHAFEYNTMPDLGIGKMKDNLKDGLKDKAKEKAKQNAERRRMLKNPTDDDARKERDRLKNGGKIKKGNADKFKKAADKFAKKRKDLEDQLESGKDKNGKPLTRGDKEALKQKINDLQKKENNARSIAKTTTEELKKREENEEKAKKEAKAKRSRALSNGDWKGAIAATKELAKAGNAAKAKTVYDNNMEKLKAEQAKIDAIKDPTVRAEAQNRLNQQKQKLDELYKASGAMGMANSILKNASKDGIRGALARKRLQNEIEKARYGQPTALTKALDLATDNKFSEAAKANDMALVTDKRDAQEFLNKTYGKSSVPSNKQSTQDILKRMADEGAKSALVGDKAADIVANEQKLKEKQAKAKEVLKNANVLTKVQRDVEAKTVTNEEQQILDRAVNGTKLKSSKAVKEAQGNFEKSKKAIKDENVAAFEQAAKNGDVNTASGVVQRVYREAKAAGLNEEETNEIIHDTFEAMSEKNNGEIKVGEAGTMKSGNFIKAAGAIARVENARQFLTTDTAQAIAQEGSNANIAAVNFKNAGIAVTTMKDVGKKGDVITGNQALSLIQGEGTRIFDKNMAVPISKDTLQQVAKFSPETASYIKTISKGSKGDAPVEVTRDMVTHVTHLNKDAGRALERVYGEKSQAQEITPEMIDKAYEISTQAGNFLETMKAKGQRIVTTGEAVNQPADKQMLVKTVANKLTAYTTGYAADITAATTVVDKMINDQGVNKTASALKTQSAVMRQIHETHADTENGGNVFISGLEQNARHEFESISQARPSNIMLTAEHAYDMSPSGMTIKQTSDFVNPKISSQKLMDIYQANPGLANELRIAVRNMPDKSPEKKIVNDLEKGVAPTGDNIGRLQTFAQNIDASLSRPSLEDYARSLVETSKTVTVHNEANNEAAAVDKRTTERRSERKAMLANVRPNAAKMAQLAVRESFDAQKHESHSHAQQRAEDKYLNGNRDRSEGQKSA